MRTFNQTCEHLTTILYEVSHHERNVDYRLVKELLRYIRILPMKGAVYAIDTLFLAKRETIVEDALRQLSHLPFLTVDRATKQRYSVAVINIRNATLPGLITSDLPLRDILLETEVYLRYSTMERSEQERMDAKIALQNLFLTDDAYSESLQKQFNRCIALFQE